jgi:long-chain acyl-CoA synthetase
MTETCVTVCMHPDGRVRLDTVGPPMPGVDVRIAASGEILVKSPGIMREYHKQPEATAEAIDAQGYFRTGDAGYFDTDGHLKVIDRARDVGKLADGTLFAPKYLENKLKFFPHIKEAVAFGAGRDRVTALLNIDLPSVGNWAEKRHLPYTGYTDLASRDEVYALVGDCVEQVNRDLAADPHLANAQIDRFLILHKELDADDGELTRTRKVRRRFVADKYGVLVEALYSGAARCPIETQVRFEDGRTGTIRAELRICKAKVFDPAGAKGAA